MDLHQAYIFTNGILNFKKASQNKNATQSIKLNLFSIFLFLR